MRATRTTRGRAASRRTSRPVKRASAKRTAVKASKPARPVKVVVAPPEPVLYKLCKPGWSVIVERIPNAQGTRFVCPFCPKSHRVPGPVRGFKKMRRAQWGRLRRVEESVIDGTLTEKRAVCGWPPARKGRRTEHPQRKKSDQDLVAAFDNCAGNDRAHHRRAQREEIHPRVCDRTDDRTQAGRIRTDAFVQGPRREGGAREGCRPGTSRRRRSTSSSTRGAEGISHG